MNFEELISYENLYRAHRVARLGKRHKRQVIEFEMNLSENLYAMYYDLKYGKYKMGEYNRFMIYDPKEREVQAIGYRDRVLQHTVCDEFLTPLLNQKLIYYNVACRKGKGTALAIKALRKFMTEHYKKHGCKGYFIKADISKYFNSIDHALLKEKLAKIVTDEKIKQLLYDIIDSYEYECGKGLPLGNQTSQNFALLYLDVLDKYITCRLGVSCYVRYMDDIIILTDSRQFANMILSEIRRKVEENKLYLNPKSQIIQVKNGVSFLGWHFFYGKNGEIVQTVKKATKQRIVKRFKGVIKYKTCDASSSLVSYNGYLSQGNAHSLYCKLKELYFSNKSNQKENQ